MAVQFKHILAGGGL